MYTDMFKALSEKTLVPCVKFNKLLTKNVESLTELQLNSVRKYSELGLAQMQAASEVTDVTSLTAFGSQQLAAMTRLSRTMMDDSNTLQGIAQNFKEDLAQLSAENLQASTSA